MAPGSGKKMMVPIIPEVIFLEYIVVRDTTFDSFTEAVNVRGSA
jgi:hypothetical protein